MNYKTKFDQFWRERQRYLNLTNISRTYENISKNLKDCRSIAEIDEYICALPSRRESNRRIMVAFFDWLEEKGEGSIETILRDKRFYDSPIERQLEIAKFLHEPRTLGDIEEKFDISGETRKKDMQALEEGIEVFGSTIALEKTRESGKDYYKCTVHPIFLPLNLTEVYAVTRFLEGTLDRSDINSNVVLDIVERIKGQLSDYALQKLHYECCTNDENDYISDEEMARQRDKICMYLIKSDQPCSFSYKGNDHRGRLRYREGKYQMVLDDGTHMKVDPNQIEFIIESLDYR